MTYFGFLGIFVGLPILALLALLVADRRRGKDVPPALRGWPVWAALATHMVVAFVYTTPWDNYLVATRVWWYDEALVTGIVLGWVPIEEYTFFLLQPLLTGLWLITLMRYLPLPGFTTDTKLPVRRIALAVTGALWMAAAVILLAGWRPGTYLGLELIWALPPIMLQLVFGADILWRYRRLVLTAILTSTVYLAVADSIAIGSGTWTINPEQSLPLLIGGVLPIEELVFFLLTNILLVFGVTLVMAEESHRRVPAIVRRWIPFLVNERIAGHEQIEVRQ